jgi:hypothetical protein
MSDIATPVTPLRPAEDYRLSFGLGGIAQLGALRLLESLRAVAREHPDCPDSEWAAVGLSPTGNHGRFETPWAAQVAATAGLVYRPQSSYVAWPGTPRTMACTLRLRLPQEADLRLAIGAFVLWGQAHLPRLPLVFDAAVGPVEFRVSPHADPLGDSGPAPDEVRALVSQWFTQWLVEVMNLPPDTMYAD